MEETVMGEALLLIFSLYVLMMFAGMMPPPTFFFAVWLDHREKKWAYRERVRLAEERRRALDQ